MSVLDSVLQYKARKEAQDAQAAQAIPMAVQAFITGRQQQIENQQKNMLMNIQAANAGYKIDNGSLVADPTSPVRQKSMVDEMLKAQRIGALQRQADDPLGVNRAVAQKKAVEEQMGVPAAESGRLTLAKEGIKNILKIRKELYPDGTPESFQRSDAFKSSVARGKAFPTSPEGQRLYRLGSTAISARQLITTGVAARPDETKSLTDAFVADAFTNPQSGFEGLQQLEDYYKDFLKTTAPNKYDQFISEIYKPSESDSNGSSTSTNYDSEKEARYQAWKASQGAKK